MNYKLKHSENENSCLECGTLVVGRKDKKFCCLSCKNAYNNRRIGWTRKYKSEIMAKLAKNYQILENLLNDKVYSVPLEELKAAGFDETCITGHRTGKGGHAECSCYDLVYRKSFSKIFGLHRIEAEDLNTKNRN